MKQSLIKAGYYARSMHKTKNSIKSEQLISEESTYYKVIGVSLVVITGLAITAMHLMPTVPL